MARILIIGDSQAGNPGAAAKAALEALGHQVTQVHNDGQGAVAYVRSADLWNQYTQNAARSDLVLLVFGHNDSAGTASRTALQRMRTGVHPPVWMSGPPLYPPTSRSTSSGQPSPEVGAALRTQNQQIFGSRYIDAWPYTPASLPRDAAGWHLTLSSAQAWGDAMAQAVNRGASSSTPERIVSAVIGNNPTPAIIVAASTGFVGLTIGVGAIIVARRRR